MGDASCTADMLVLKKATKHCNESNENLISDEININLSRELNNQLLQSKLSPDHHLSSSNKPARNNNYFDVENSGPLLNNN